MAKLSQPRSKIERLRAAVRQWMYPTEFRIGEAVWSEKIAEHLGQELMAARATAEHDGLEVADKHLVAIGNRLWRLQSEMKRSDGDQPPKALRHALKHLEVLWDRFAEAGLDIYDHTGEIIPEGDYGLRVLAYQPTNKVTCNSVIETVKPTIRFHKKTIQVGEVIVGTPEKPN